MYNSPVPTARAKELVMMANQDDLSCMRSEQPNRVTVSEALNRISQCLLAAADRNPRSLLGCVPFQRSRVELGRRGASPDTRSDKPKLDRAHHFINIIQVPCSSGREFLKRHPQSHWHSAGLLL